MQHQGVQDKYDEDVRELAEAVDDACAPVADEAWERVRPLIAALYSDEALDALPRPDVAALIRRMRSGELPPG